MIFGIKVECVEKDLTNEEKMLFDYSKDSFKWLENKINELVGFKKSYFDLSNDKLKYSEYDIPSSDISESCIRDAVQNDFKNIDFASYLEEYSKYYMPIKIEISEKILKEIFKYDKFKYIALWFGLGELPSNNIIDYDKLYNVHVYLCKLIKTDLELEWFMNEEIDKYSYSKEDNMYKLIKEWDDNAFAGSTNSIVIFKIAGLFLLYGNINIPLAILLINRYESLLR